MNLNTVPTKGNLMAAKSSLALDNRCEGSGITNLGISGKQLVCDILMIVSRESFTNAVLHKN